jgi:hypothetical protein
MRVEVTFHAPAMGMTAVPMGLSGPGVLESDATGLKLTALLHSKNAASLFGCFGVAVSFGLLVAVMIAAKIEPSSQAGKSLIGVVFFGGLFGSILAGRKLFPPKQATVLVPWAKLKKLSVDGMQITFQSKGKPSGQVWFTAEKQAELLAALTEEARRAGGG